ncbi:serine/threonine-protein kinase [Fimbriiglobus ruber]|uniref:serine/threonine-protein kinase n=1 Tax=Fimbriiglobus ruber TaxID=1908690 RepID=UPI000B4AFB81|nr:serine/threonine-protein kinase [Fimbriiglobus ruber]
MQILTSLELDEGREIGCGQGRNSRVYLVDDPQLGGTFALKKIDKSSLPNSSAWWEETKRMYASEHEHVLPIRYGCQTTDHICLILPYCKNGTLADKIVDKSVSLRELIKLGQGILLGVGRIHSAGLCHFDIKPTNILFSDTHQPLVADFGQARPIGPYGTAHPPGRMYNYALPPELCFVYQGSPASDLYQVALTLYRAVNSDRFFLSQASTHPNIFAAISSGTFPDRDAFQPHVPLLIRKVIKKGLELLPADRYANASEFANDLGRINPSKDWFLEQFASGEKDWTCHLDSHRKIKTRLFSIGPKWGIEIHSENNGVRRALKKVLWKRDLTGREADIQLRKVFRVLEN